MEDLESKLSDEVAIAAWEVLLPHAERDALVWVASDLTLAEVGVAVAKDSVEQVTAWMESGKIRKPTREQLDAWNEAPNNFFQFLIVQPYVLFSEYFLGSRDIH